MASTKYVPPYNLADPKGLNDDIARRGRFVARYACFYQLKAYFAVTEMAKMDKNKIAEQFEKAFDSAVDKCPYLPDEELKIRLKKEMAGDGKSGWTRAKDHKRIMVQWNAAMKPWEKVPSGEPDEDDYLVKKLRASLWKQKRGDTPIPDHYEPSKCWSAYCLLKLWRHSKVMVRPKKEDDSVEQKLREVAHGRNKQRTAERTMKEANKQARTNENFNLKNSSVQASLIRAKAEDKKAEAALKLVSEKRERSKMEAMSAFFALPESVSQYIGTPEKKKICKAYADSLLATLTESSPRTEIACVNGQAMAEGAALEPKMSDEEFPTDKTVNDALSISSESKSVVVQRTIEGKHEVDMAARLAIEARRKARDEEMKKLLQETENEDDKTLLLPSGLTQKDKKTKNPQEASSPSTNELTSAEV